MTGAPRNGPPGTPGISLPPDPDRVLRVPTRKPVPCRFFEVLAAVRIRSVGDAGHRVLKSGPRPGPELLDERRSGALNMPGATLQAPDRPCAVTRYLSLSTARHGNSRFGCPALRFRLNTHQDPAQQLRGPNSERSSRQTPIRRRHSLGDKGAATSALPLVPGRRADQVNVHPDNVAWWRAPHRQADFHSRDVKVL